MIPGRINTAIYIFCLSGIALFLPLSEYMLSLFIILLSVNFLGGIRLPDLKENIQKNKTAFMFLVSFLVYIIWIINSDDKSLALSALRLKLPLLALPVIVLCSKAISSYNRKLIYYSFLLGLAIATLAGFITWQLDHSALSERRDMSLFISHIRLSLMVILGVVLAISLFRTESNPALRIILLIISAWFIVFTFLLFSFTGLLIALILLFVLILRFFLKKKSWVLRIGILTLSILLLVLCYIGFSSEYKRTFGSRESDEIDLNSLSLNGNKYIHHPHRKDKEMGYYVWRYICTEELKSEWNKRSELDFDGKDERGHKLEYTLIRYLASKGYKKDSLGISMLDTQDINIIEKGYASCIYKDSGILRIRFYELFWQIDYYRNGGSPQGHSITQRIEFMLTGLRVFRSYPLFGTGSGDYIYEMQKQYELDSSLLDSEHRRSSHNQYILSLASFGIVGALLFWSGIFIPLFIRGDHKSLILSLFLIILLCSMLWEDTLETHTGVSFFAFFYFILYFHPPDARDK